MTGLITPIDRPTAFPDHTQLPESDGTFVKNFQEHPQSILLTDSLGPTLQQRHPDGNYCIGQDCGIYWRETDPPEKGAVAPDWFYVPDVPPTFDGVMRRSYVLWREFGAPLIVLEFSSRAGEEERDQTPLKGKFWAYERVIRPAFYGIYEITNHRLEVYHFVDGAFQLLNANQRDHYPIAPLGVELGVWQGSYQNQTGSWLRWWDPQGNLLLIGDERAEQEHQRAEQEHQRAEQERQRAEQERQRAEQERQRANEAEQRIAQLAERLRALGVDPDARS